MDGKVAQFYLLSSNHWGGWEKVWWAAYNPCLTDRLIDYVADKYPIIKMTPPNQTGVTGTAKIPQQYHNLMKAFIRYRFGLISSDALQNKSGTCAAIRK